MKNALIRISLVTAGAALIGGCISGTPVDTSTGNPADLTGTFALDSIGAARLPVVVGTQDGAPLYVTSLVLTFDGQGNYGGTEKDSTGGPLPFGGDVTTLTVSGNYFVGPTASWNVGPESLRTTSLGAGRITATGFTIETNASGGVMYFGKRS
ncbi:MAG TPA: hypothetical protein VII52_12705 [Gemmatimonadaceae bacterium]